jgi:acetyl esterase/lipase
MKAVILSLSIFSGFVSCLSAKPITLDIWPSIAPGETGDIGAEYDRTGSDGRLVAGKRVIRLTNVTVPTIAVYKPKPELDTGAAVVIAPGGGFNILAYDLEGTEVAEWLNSIGVTGIVLKYRVPARDPDKRWQAAVQDAQRAMSLVRSRADEWRIDPDRIGLMGFSAGGWTTQFTALAKKRLYEPVDEVDQVSFRPDFAMPIYGGSDDLPDECAITQESPPFFMVIAHDDKDRSVNVAKLYIRLKEADVPAELHIYESGGHGYGLRRTGQPVTSWPDRMANWMEKLGLLDPRKP